jgi:metallophosphoesterase (TIGR03767 family)
VIALTAAGTAAAQTTLDETIVGDPSAPFSTLAPGPGDPRTVRTDLGSALPGRDTTRESLIYFGQLTDFQLPDEESPARVEFFDMEPLSTFSNSGYRPHEPLAAQAASSAIEQMNALTTSPVPDGSGNFASMENVILTGDLADSNQRNEVEWVRTLLEGGTLDPNSGKLGPGSGNFCGNLVEDPSKYTGVGDYNDNLESPLFYDPNQPAFQYAAWPNYPGLFDRAQNSFTTPGLAVPSYVAPGNHDVLVQGNEDANVAFETVALGCLKPMGPFPQLSRLSDTLNQGYLFQLLQTSPDKVLQVAPDPQRQYVDKKQYKTVIGDGAQPDDHGFAFVDPVQNQRSKGSAQYYSWNPVSGVRFIVLDSNSTGGGLLLGPGEDPGSVATSAEGNIDHPQWVWLRSELDEATANNELVVTFAHHSMASMTYNVPDELALPCLGIKDKHGHEFNPGCDLDPRFSTPLHLGKAVTNLYGLYPNVIAHVSGHSHDNVITAYNPAGPGGFYDIRTSAIADWPSQSRVLEIFDNNDGTLSIFGTLLNTAAPIAAPPSGTPAAGFTPDEMASVARTLTYNDPQAGPGAEGDNGDRNVELLINDPR